MSFWKFFERVEFFVVDGDVLLRLFIGFEVRFIFSRACGGAEVKSWLREFVVVAVGTMFCYYLLIEIVKLIIMILIFIRVFCVLGIGLFYTCFIYVRCGNYGLERLGYLFRMCSK